MNSARMSVARRSSALALGGLIVGALVLVATLTGCAVHPAGSPSTDPASPTDDGTVPPGTTVFDDDVAAVSRLNAQLRDALRAASTAAQADGVEVRINSGWRSTALQERLLRDAVETYGSPAEAARWVATPETSPHVSGDAVDVGPWEAAEWLGRHGAPYGLCQIYINEAWHFELRTEAPTQGCPRMYLDPTEDPRMAPR
ncbi:M15 family metallopeptidase [Microbacterium sp. TNHR37B]|uniref:M15 family metallopeptidase n=1 Tax=Microbacterium sp. TNHR37B TaxID=1775956 RepID=UPI0007B27A14|nr:M15 family metallopeptidase [Microbacterium sp. TNHR37B]KZE89152.1 D-alanyl-D-alanine carboxypeptidase [Microbacterium sp. TNHR37B]